jgi:hypothetical protein
VIVIGRKNKKIIPKFQKNSCLKDLNLDPLGQMTDALINLNKTKYGLLVCTQFFNAPHIVDSTFLDVF